MLTEEKKKNKNYGSIFVYCFFCFVLIVETEALVEEVARFAKPYYNNLPNLMETEALVEEGFVNLKKSGILQGRSRSASVPALDHQKLSVEVIREDRSRHPSSYCVTFKSFATMAKLVKDNGDKYESRPFSVGGYNWTLIIYPNNNKPLGSGNFVSMYVRIDNSTFIHNQRDVYAEITFLSYKSTTDKYKFVQESDAQRFHFSKQEWGKLQFLGIGYYTENNGYVFDGGKSVFGVDILVTDPFKHSEVFSYEENILDPLAKFNIPEFYARGYSYHTLGPISSGGRNWILKVYPNGVGRAMGNSLSVFLLSASNEKGYVKANLRVLDQIRSTHVEKQVEGWPNATGWGVEEFLPLADIKNASKGFLVNDTLKVEVEMLSFSKVDYI